MDATYPVCLNWTNVETILKMFHIKPYRMLINKIKLAEKLAIKQAAETLKKG